MEDKSLTSMVITVIVALIVTGAVLVPIIGGLTDNDSGGEGSSGDAPVWIIGNEGTDWLMDYQTLSADTTDYPHNNTMIPVDFDDVGDVLTLDDIKAFTPVYSTQFWKSNNFYGYTNMVRYDSGQSTMVSGIMDFGSSTNFHALPYSGDDGYYMFDGVGSIYYRHAFEDYTQYTITILSVEETNMNISREVQIDWEKNIEGDISSGTAYATLSGDIYPYTDDAGAVFPVVVNKIMGNSGTEDYTDFYKFCVGQEIKYRYEEYNYVNNVDSSVNLVTKTLTKDDIENGILISKFDSAEDDYYYEGILFEETDVDGIYSAYPFYYEGTEKITKFTQENTEYGDYVIPSYVYYIQNGLLSANESGGEGSGGSSDNGDLGTVGTIIGVIPVFVVLAILIYAVQYLRTRPEQY